MRSRCEIAGMIRRRVRVKGRQNDPDSGDASGIDHGTGRREGFGGAAGTAADAEVGTVNLEDLTDGSRRRMQRAVSR